MNRDFIDDDLEQDGGPRDGEEAPLTESPIVPAAALTAGARERLVRQQAQLTSQVSGTAEELESLRRRQRDLEQEKRHLEALSERQRGYEAAKKEAMERLGAWAGKLEKEHARVARQIEVLGETRRAFATALVDLQGIDESAWGDKSFEAQLEAAMGRVEDAANVWRRGVARVEAVGFAAARGQVPGTGETEEAVPARVPDSFRFWLKAGTAFAVPLAAVAILIFLAWLMATGIWPR